MFCSYPCYSASETLSYFWHGANGITDWFGLVLPFLLRRRVIEPEQIWDYDPRPGGPNVIYHSTQLDKLSLCLYVCMCVYVCVCVCYKFSHSPFSVMAAPNRTVLFPNGCLHSRIDICKQSENINTLHAVNTFARRCLNQIKTCYCRLIAIMTRVQPFFYC